MSEKQRYEIQDEKTPLKSFMKRPAETKVSPSKPKKKKSHFREYFEAFLTALLIAFFLRAFVVEAFKIPSKSMVPTLMVGDHIFVNKFVYGIRLPFTKNWIAHFNNPQRGEVIVFIYPRNPSLDFIKRVVGLPGDTVAVKGDDLLVNGEKVMVTPLVPIGVDKENPRILDVATPPETNGKEIELPFFREWKEFNFFIEKLGVASHFIQEEREARGDEIEKVVPPGHLFVMGDNRDNSSDSREWGFVPLDNVKGRAMFIWLSPDVRPGLPIFKSLFSFFKDMRWERLGKGIE